MKKVFGAFILLLGIVLLAWIGYVLATHPGGAPQGRNPAGGLVTALAFIYVGSNWVRGRSAR